jgi:hypothetical protein
MPYFIIEDFRSGLDSRRMPVLSVPGSLLELKNAHINRGGEIEKRLAFVEQITFPANTFGLQAVGGTLYTFGSVAANTITFPSDAPANLLYQRLQHPSGLAMTKLIHATAFAGKPYAIAQYTDGSIFHFYDGVRHQEFVEARARTNVDITGGTAGGISATASFTVTGGINSPGDRIEFVRANNIPILNAPIQHNGDNAATAAAIAAAINAFVGDPDFTAAAASNVVTITSVTPGASFNGLVLNISVTGGFTVGSVVNFSGGVDNAIANLTVDGVRIIGEPVLHTGNNAETAALVAAAINDYQSAPEYRATAIGTTVNITIQQEGSANNSKVLTITRTGNVTTTPSATANFAGGSNLVTSPAGSETYLPSEYAKPAKSKMYSTAGSLLHFSQIEDPLDVNNIANAGFINLSTNAEGSERLTAVANYQNNLAVFSERTVQVWFIDVDPALNQQLQVLNNTGAISPHSVQEIGDSDVFYLSESGIRSLRARDSSNAAFSTDIGNPIDNLILQEINTNRLAARDAEAVLEPRDGRYMMAIGNRVYVFSFFPASKVSAWSVYELNFGIVDWAIIGRRLFCRGSDNKLYLYGGNSGREYDSSEVVAQLPFVAAGKPATSKEWIGADMALEGLWTVQVSTDPNNIDARQVVATVEEITMNKGHLRFQARSSHVALRLSNQEPGPAKVGAIFIHYQDGSQG